MDPEILVKDLPKSRQSTDESKENAKNANAPDLSTINKNDRSMGRDANDLESHTQSNLKMPTTMKSARGD